MSHAKTLHNDIYKEKPVQAKMIPKAAQTNRKTTVELVSPSDNDAFYFRMLEQKGICLNENQLKAVRHTEGPLLTLAGAGSGKTSVLTSRVGYMLSVKEIRAENILLLTFTRKAAGEMKDRITRIPGITQPMLRHMMVGTFHSVFLRILKSKGYDQKILSNERHKQIIIKKILKEMGLKDEYDPETLLSQFSYYKNMLIPPQKLQATTPVEKEVKAIYTSYDEFKIEHHYMDFDDILYFTYDLLTEDDELRTRLQERFQYILIDEFQDTNLAQYEVLKMIAEPRNNLMVVGDDDQTIYQFRGSNHKIILEFPSIFPHTEIVTLDINYRSNPYIVGLGNEVIQYNRERHEKKLNASHTKGLQPSYANPVTTTEEATAVIERIVADVNDGKREFRDIAVLYRTHAVSRAIVDQLVWKEIPFVLHSNKDLFYEQGLVRPVLDYLRLSLNPNNLEAVMGICPTLYLNRDRTLDFIRNKLLEGELTGDRKPALHYLRDLPQLKAFQKKQLEERIKMIETLKEKTALEAIKEIRSGTGQYEAYLQDNKRQTFTLHKDIIQETLDELSESASHFKDLRKYIAFVEKIIEKHYEMENLRKQENPDAVSLMTIHGAKGLEFPVVYLIGASEQILPHSSSLEAAEDRPTEKASSEEQVNESVEEERRLMYVSITRAMEELYISSPKYFRTKQLEISRFLKEAFEQ
ncbi:ATP-dependent helicase [Bacillus tianshenii]|nr:ATP-dependent helicase [Bacillus tianshenii]